MLSLLARPERIGRYRVLSELGHGSMGHVYLALDPNIDRNIALKIFFPLLKVGVREELELRQRFLIEARAAGKLKHSGIVTVFDADSDPKTGLPFIVMEWINGPSLQDLLLESGPLAVPTAASIVEEIAVALDAAHDAGLVHRDVKPANILIDGAGRAKITDFGIAKLASMSITGSGWIPGSPFYMSPEQVRNEGVDGRSDLYSLGAVLYQCLTGAVPFEGDSLASLTYMILEIDPRPPQALNPSITDGMASVIRTAMEKSPADRFQSGAELAAAVRAAVTETTPLPAGPRRAVAPNARTTSTTLLLPPLADEPAAPEPDSESSPRPARRLGSTTAAASLAGISILLAAFGVAAWLPANSAGTPPRTLQVARASLAVAGQDGLRGLDALVPPLEAIDEPESQAEAEVAAAPAERPRPRRQPSPTAERPLAQATATTAPEFSLAPQSAAAGRTETAGSPTAVVQTRGPSTTIEAAPLLARSTLEVLYRNRLKSASISVWIDEVKVWSEAISAPKSAFKRIKGRDVWTTLEIPEGHHTIDVRLTGGDGKLDLVRRTEAEFAAGETRRLRVVLTLTPRHLKLNWKQPTDG